MRNRAVRLALGGGFLASIYGIYALCLLIPGDAPVVVLGTLVGLAIGTAEAIAGAYKDGTIEGFSWSKFAKSPTFGALGGFIASGHTDNPVSLLLAAVGIMRMLLELVFKIVVPGYAPGKFRSMTGPFTEWRSRRHLFLPPYVATWALYLVLATHPGWHSTALAIASAASDLPPGLVSASGGCQLSPSDRVERQYTVRGRVRPLLIWTARHEVGGARFVRSEGDLARRLELVIGTDPHRAPMRLNRWGYIAETVCGANATLVGLMTQSDEATIDEATNLASAPGGRPFKAIRATITPGVMHTELFRLAPADNPTYQQLDAMLGRLPAPGEGRRAMVPTGADSGFLVALTGLMHDSVAASRRSGQGVQGLRRTYVYDGKIYDLTLRTSRLADLSIEAGELPQVLDGEFEIRNQATGHTTDFRLAYGTSGAEREVPLRAAYRPRWWIEIELLLAPSGTG